MTERVKGRKRVFSGTWEEIAAQAEEFAGKHVEVTVQEQEDDTASGKDPRNLLEFLGDTVGCVQGGGEARSENTGERFTAYLERKRAEGRL